MQHFLNAVWHFLPLFVFVGDASDRLFNYRCANICLPVFNALTGFCWFPVQISRKSTSGRSKSCIFIQFYASSPENSISLILHHLTRESGLGSVSHPVMRRLVGGVMITSDCPEEEVSLWTLFIFPLFVQTNSADVELTNDQTPVWFCSSRHAVASLGEAVEYLLQSCQERSDDIIYSPCPQWPAEQTGLMEARLCRLKLPPAGRTSHPTADGAKPQGGEESEKSASEKRWNAAVVQRRGETSWIFLSSATFMGHFVLHHSTTAKGCARLNPCAPSEITC